VIKTEEEEKVADSVAIHTTIKQITGRGVVDGNDYDNDYNEGSGHDNDDDDGRRTTTTTTMADTVGGMATTG
jgi:hypothetical protein